MSEEGTLAEIFNQLTGFTEHKEIADQIVSIVHEGDDMNEFRFVKGFVSF